MIAVAMPPFWAETDPLPPWLEAVAGDAEFDWAVKAWRRAAAASEAWFDSAKADKVVALWPRVFRLTDDRFAGKPFRLNRWQEIIVRLLVGWKVPVEIADADTGAPTRVHVRLFRRLMLWVPRKNGKSEFLAALALLFWALEGVVGGQGYVFARDEDQAELAFNKMKAMVAYNEALAGDIQAHKKSLYLKTRAAGFHLLTGAEEGKHGKGPIVIVGDEMHEWKSRKIENDLRQGTGTRLQPIELYASTAGLKTNLVGVELWDESLSILEGKTDDPTTLVALFAAAAEDEWNDEATWARANPSLGLSPTVPFLRREASLALGNPRKEATFRCYHLNQWVESTARWIPLKKWDACAPDKKAWRRYGAELKGRRCFGAFDVSATKDITAKILVFPPEDEAERWKLACRFWVPEETLAERIKTDRIDYTNWLADGALETTPGDYVDQNYVQRAMLEDMADYEVERWGFDSWNAKKLVADLQQAGVDPELFMEIRQGILSMGEPSKHFERLVFAGILDHGGHPLLRWMAGNAVVRFDENMNFMPAKKRSAEKIDGIVATVMGIGVAMADHEQDHGGVAAWLQSLKGAEA
ncbi:MAG TPA: terminase TerL endonuclease subunit [Allosphingosinicella sp.]|nr:terminase TerL endonuclease subunit [Allosphingosinicella sp.]